MKSKMSAPRSGSPYPPEKEPGAETPNPDLNPMVNPTLSRNLGKWAEAYYTNPPEKREQAVVDLLRELQGAPGGNGTSSELPRQTKREPSEVAQQVADVPSFRSALACAQCGRGHAPEQAFCGYCGATLKGAAPQSDAGVSQALPKNNPAVLAPPQSPTSRMTKTEQSDLQWLREKTLTSFGSYDEERDPLRTLAAVVLAIALAGFFYSEWRNRASARPYQGPAVSVSSPAAPPTPEPTAGSSEISKQAQQMPLASTSSPSESVKLPPAEKPAASEARSAPIDDSRRMDESTPAASLRGAESVQPVSNDTGGRELAIAEAFLRGGTRARDTGDAMKWLWKSVSKHNSAALVVLADLYERGDGIAKNCDQAQVLLVAAAKQGSVEAGQRLKHLQSSGCK